MSKRSSDATKRPGRALLFIAAAGAIAYGCFGQVSDLDAAPRRVLTAGGVPAMEGFVDIEGKHFNDAITETYSLTHTAS